MLVNVPRSYYYNYMLPPADQREPTPEALHETAARTKDQIIKLVKMAVPESWTVDVETFPDDGPLGHRAVLPDARRKATDWGIVAAVAAAAALLTALASWIQIVRRPARLPEMAVPTRRYRADSADEPTLSSCAASPSHGRQPKREPVDLKRLFSGLVFIGHHKVVLGAILLDLFAVLLGNATGLLPIFARDIFMSGPLSFGALRAAPAAGALLSALTLARWPISRHVGRIMFAAVATFGTGTILLALSPSLPFAMGAMFIVGAADTVSVVIRQSLLLLHTPDEMRGRVFAVARCSPARRTSSATFAPAPRRHCSAPFRRS